MAELFDIGAGDVCEERAAAFQSLGITEDEMNTAIKVMRQSCWLNGVFTTVSRTWRMKSDDYNNLSFVAFVRAFESRKEKTLIVLVPLIVLRMNHSGRQSETFI